MISYQKQYELAQSLCSDNDATNLVLLKTFITQGQRKLEVELRIYQTEETRTFDTEASVSSYKRPENFKTLSDLYVTVGTTQYRADLIQDPDLWREINSTTTQSTSDFLQFCFIRSSRIELYPIPTSDDNEVTIIYNSLTKPLTQDDYTTGTITTLTNDTATVGASGTTFTSAMIGRYFRIDADGEWYKISALLATTAITLDLNYQGVTISAGTSAYTIGQMPLTPADTHELPVYYAVWRWALMKKDVQIAREFERMWKEGVADAKANWANKSSSNVTKGHYSLRRRRVTNPNNYPLGMSNP